MIDVKWLLLIIPACLGLSFLLFSMCVAVARADERIKKMRRIVEVREEVIQTLIDEGFVETGRAEGDYDLSLSPKGTEDIQKILEGLI